MDATESELRHLTHRLLDAIRNREWATYAELCDPSLTCFEPESRGELVEGLGFHKFYFDSGGHLGKHADTLSGMNIRLLGRNIGVVCYVRLVQQIDDSGCFRTARFEETRIWHRTKRGWRHVHFHRSLGT